LSLGHPCQMEIFIFAKKNDLILHLKSLKVDISFCMFLLKSLFKMFS